MSRDSHTDTTSAKLEESDPASANMPFLMSSLRALSLLDRWTGGRCPEPPPKEEEEKPRDERTLAIISLDEVAWHDTVDDCWLVICDYVYDCTNFVKSHPGGQDILVEYAGRDATIAFIGSGHSQGAKGLLEKFLIGELPKNEIIFRTPNGIKVGDFA